MTGLNGARADRLPGWAYRTRTAESVRELSDWNCVTTSPEVGARLAAETLCARGTYPTRAQARRAQQRLAEAEPHRSFIPLSVLRLKPHGDAPSEHPPVGRRRGFDTVVQTVSGMPFVDDFVPGFEASAQFGLGAPKNTPVEVIEKLNHEINAGLTDPKMKARLADLAGAVLAGSPADFRKLIADETEKWGKVVKFSGAKPD